MRQLDCAPFMASLSFPASDEEVTAPPDRPLPGNPEKRSFLDLLREKGRERLAEKVWDFPGWLLKVCFPALFLGAAAGGLVGHQVARHEVRLALAAAGVGSAPAPSATPPRRAHSSSSGGGSSGSFAPVPA